MQEEIFSRAEKIEMARKAMDQRRVRRRGSWEGARSQREYTGEEGILVGNYFFLRVLLSGFLLLALMGITKFNAMGEEQANTYQVTIVKALKTQTGVDKIKEFIQTTHNT